MQKLKLDLDTLAVESYATAATGTPEGTVAAHSDPNVTIFTDKVITAVTWATEKLSVLC